MPASSSRRPRDTRGPSGAPPRGFVLPPSPARQAPAGCPAQQARGARPPESLCLDTPQGICYHAGAFAWRSRRPGNEHQPHRRQGPYTAPAVATRLPSGRIRYARGKSAWHRWRSRAKPSRQTHGPVSCTPHPSPRPCTLGRAIAPVWLLLKAAGKAQAACDSPCLGIMTIPCGITLIAAGSWAGGQQQRNLDPERRR